MPTTNTVVMPAGKFAGQPITELESTYIVYTLENTNLVGELRESLLKELHRRFFGTNNKPKGQ